MTEASAMWVRALAAVAGIADGASTMARRLALVADRHGPRTALSCEAASLSYTELATKVNQYAAWAQRQGIRKGDVVGLLMPNCAEYAAIWIGIGAAGGAVALLNTELQQGPLRHAISAVGPCHLIADEALAGAVDAVRPTLPPGLRCWLRGRGRPGWNVLEPTGLPAAAEPPGPPPALADTALYIYTSGTTGLPKAVRLSHGRVLEWSLWFAGMLGVTPADRMYDCLPMYHSVGGVVAIGAMLMGGGSVLIRPTFSASRFWDDVVDGGCTLFQYVGELCRYLVNAAPHPRERAHRLRMVCGNGMQAEVWPRFVERFQVPRVLEYYAATEGSLSFYNTEQRPGSVGRIPPYLAHRFPVALIRLDPGTGEPFRDAEGRCRRCEPGESGEAIGPAPAAPLYTDPSASEAKLLRDVFVPGDVWFRSGDLMRRDRAGYYGFVDRLGDTFRWKGENVSTAEVAGVIGACPGVLEATVYGVAVPGFEGRAGMAAIVADDRFHPDALRAYLMDRLPLPARPAFLRLQSRLEATGTFKPLKARLVQEGFDPARTTDPLLVFDRNSGSYVTLGPAMFSAIAAGQVRL